MEMILKYLRSGEVTKIESRMFSLIILNYM